MSNRVRLRADDREWVATVAGDRVAIADPNETFVVAGLSDGRATVQPAGGGDSLKGSALRSGDAVWVSVGGALFEFQIAPDRAAARPATHHRDALSPPMAATVIRVVATVGAVVKQGETLVILEAMKMELTVKSPRDATVKSINCREGDLVQPGTALVDLD